MTLLFEKKTQTESRFEGNIAPWAFALAFALALGPVVQGFSQGAASALTTRFDYPRLGSLGSDDLIFKQHQEEVAAAYAALGYLPAVRPNNTLSTVSAARFIDPPIHSLIFYTYVLRTEVDLFSLAARLNLPYETLATLNRIDRSRGLAPGEKILVPSAPGLFCPQTPKSDLEMLVSYRDEGGSVDLVAEGSDGRTAFRFYPGARLNAEERALFLGFLFRFPLPAGRLSSGFGPRLSPVSGRTMAHSGIDLAAPAGTEVYAAREGRIVAAGIDAILGEYLIIEHEGGWTSVYGHLSKRIARLNETVESGIIIGRVGSTGLSTGPHLHFEVRNRGEARDPGLLIPKGKR